MTDGLHQPRLGADPVVLPPGERAGVPGWEQLLDYDRATGTFTWRKRQGTANAGARAGTVNKNGYLQVSIHKRRIYVHRLVWFAEHGAWPAGDVDHINGDRSDNRIENLRDVSRAVNAQNQRRPTARSISGFLGVTFRKGKFHARIKTDDKVTLLGGYPTAEEAHQAYVVAKRRMHAGCTL